MYKFIIGYTTHCYLLLDFDDTTLNKVKGISNLLTIQYKLGSYIIMKSSCGKNKFIKVNNEVFVEKTIDGSYHVIFGRKIRYSKICDIINLLANLDVLQSEYANIRNWRNDITLRITRDTSKLAFREKPILVYERIITDNFLDNEGVLSYKAVYDVVD